MNSQDIEDKQLLIIDGQLITTILYTISLLISIVIIINQRKRAKGEEGFLTTSEEENITLLNKILIIALLCSYIYLNYKSKDLSEKTGNDTSSLELQIKASWITLIPALIGLYVVATDFSNTNFQTAEIENPFI